MNTQTPTAYTRRARTAKDAAMDTAMLVPYPSRHDDERAFRLAEYARLCADMAVRAGGLDSAPVVTARADDYAEEARLAWRMIRYARQVRAGLRVPAGGKDLISEDQRVPMHLQ